jgi:hypothetical protein
VNLAGSPNRAEDLVFRQIYCFDGHLKTYFLSLKSDLYEAFSNGRASFRASPVFVPAGSNLVLTLLVAEPPSSQSGLFHNLYLPGVFSFILAPTSHSYALSRWTRAHHMERSFFRPVFKRILI